MCTVFNVKADIIFLNGTSSAGKTSIARELTDLLKNSVAIHLDTYQGELLQGIQDLAMKYQHVVVDTIFFEKSKLLKAVTGYKSCFVLVYCPLDHVLQHVKQRNLTGCLEDKRFFYVALSQFIYLYKKESCSSIPLDKMKLTNFIGVAQHIEKRKDYVVGLYKAKFLVRQELCFAPKMEYDLVVNSGSLNSLACAQQIIECLKV